ncbi:hypothetical protein SAMN05216586_12024 [Halopseudomonas aestusnigri]|uniref:Uncharacterized protein n=1 Tax=Halopseudomonas aestusnigri TaxID=857252 RepID=A0AAQ1GA79_9GAMM|nr:hypothetical protein SAMN05216586_12024 [Halopseudomonas aestusnigri]
MTTTPDSGQLSDEYRISTSSIAFNARDLMYLLFRRA